MKQQVISVGIYFATGTALCVAFAAIAKAISPANPLPVTADCVAAVNEITTTCNE